MKRKVLIFTYYFPPAGGVAVQRFLKFSKFLPEFGWEPVIVTVANGSYPYYDESLLQEISDSVKVYRTKTFEPFELYNLLKGKKGKAMPVVTVGAQENKSFFQKISEYIRANYFIPDARKGWVPYALKQAEEILKTEKIEAIITTGPPHSTHLIGLQLKKKYGLKWIADFRDPWTGIFYNQILPRTAATVQKDKCLETEVLQNADVVTVISPGMKKEFTARAKQVEVIFNGFDGSDFNLQRKTQQPENFTIRYVGNLMASQNVEIFWSAVQQLLKANLPLRIEFVGRVDEPVKQSIAQHGLSDIVEYLDFVDHKKAVELMQDAGLLLFVIPQVKDNELILTGKLFEYLAANTEIISFGPVHGNAADILVQTGRKPMIDFADDKTAIQQLEAAITVFRQTKRSYKYNNRLEQTYTRRSQTGALAELLNRLMG